MLKPSDYFEMNGFEFAAIFDDCEYVWDALSNVGRFALNYIMDFQNENNIMGTVMKGAFIDDKDAIIIGEGTVV